MPDKGRNKEAQPGDRKRAVPSGVVSRRAVAMAIVTLATAALAVRFFAGAAWTAAAARNSACRTLMPDPLLPKLRGLAPDFDLADASGKRWSLHALRGQPVLVSFWATWCPPCVQEMPSLEALARRLGDRATILAVSVDENWEAIRKFFPKGTPLTVLLDPSRAAPASYGTSQFPESFLIDPSGHVRYAFINQRDWSVPEAAACIEDLR
ncbi:MAG TPA: TlpA disulfide reductase family protein [Polyangia bacterium]|nr:TlpA disulfide reductase family protein [Polyangia bacterium]